MTNLELLTTNLQFARLHLQWLVCQFELTTSALASLAASIEVCKHNAEDVQTKSTTKEERN